VAIIAILQHQSSLSARLLNSQLSFALNSRIIIEQAEGMISQSAGNNMGESFGRLRSHARNHNLRLTDVVARVVEGTLDVATLDFPRQGTN
jgi:AmiR/NasT family two-component response regulator